MPKRLVGVLAIVLFALGLLGAPAAATEGETAPAGEQEPAPTIDQIGQHNEITQEYFPEPSEPPQWTQWLYYPLLIMGVLAAAMLLLRYLQWQPRFAEERRNRRRR
jgi:hypothetical protein